jgi:hypothetical protein
MKIAMLGTRRIEKNAVLITSASMLEVNALLSAQSKKHRDGTALSSAG